MRWFQNNEKTKHDTKYLRDTYMEIPNGNFPLIIRNVHSHLQKSKFILKYVKYIVINISEIQTSIDWHSICKVYNVKIELFSLG